MRGRGEEGDSPQPHFVPDTKRPSLALLSELSDEVTLFLPLLKESFSLHIVTLIDDVDLPSMKSNQRKSASWTSCICSVSQSGELTLAAAPSTHAHCSGDETEKTRMLHWGGGGGSWGQAPAG